MLKNRTYHTLITFVICILMSFSCNTSKNTNEVEAAAKNTLSIQLNDTLTSKYIATTYKEYNPTDMSPSNKTLNQYIVDFNCSADAFAKLQELLAADTNVQTIENINQIDRQSSKSVKSAKTKSIRNNN